MELTLNYNLPFVAVTIQYQGARLSIANVLVDTGSASTIFAADVVSGVGIVPQPEDLLHTIQGVGGDEVVFVRKIEEIQLGEQSVKDFTVEVGGMDYGFEINGILGMDFLTQSGAIIDLRTLSITFHS
jgi:hypothetical protein